MNEKSDPTINVTFSGTLNIPQSQLEQLLGHVAAVMPLEPVPPTVKMPEGDQNPKSKDT